MDTGLAVSSTTLTGWPFRYAGIRLGVAAFGAGCRSTTEYGCEVAQ